MSEHRRRREKRQGIFFNSLKPRVLKGLISFQNFWRIVHALKEPVPWVVKILRELEEEGYIQRENGLWKATEKGEKLLKSSSTTVPFQAPCACCLGTGMELERYQEIYQQFLAMVENRPKALAEYDQGYISPWGTVARVMRMDMHGDVEGKEILILGDDDLVSIALALTKKPKSIVVLEIDERITDFIRKTSQKIGYTALEGISFDLTQPLPSSLLKRFDVFETDPTESLSGFKMFLTRGMASLKGMRCSGYFGLTRLEASLWKWGKIESFLLRSRFVITEILPDFHRYEHWEYHPETRAGKLNTDPLPEDFHWYTSALVRIEWIQPLEIPNQVWRSRGKKIYQDEESSTS